MKKQKRIFIGVLLGCLLFFGVIYIGGSVFLKWIDEPMYPVVPKKSLPSKVILASRGCCFAATDVTVSLLDDNGNKNVIISEEKVYEYDIFECQNIPEINSPIQVVIEFTSHYVIEEYVSLIIGEFFNTNDLLEKGLLLRFDDGGLIVRNGNNEKIFCAGVFGSVGDESPWYQAK